MPISVPNKGNLLTRLQQAFNDLRKHEHPTLLIFDTYETVHGSRIGEWVEKVVLLTTARADWLRVVIAGQKIPKITAYLPWAPRSHSLLLEQPSCEDWIECAGPLQLKGKEELIPPAYELAKGRPSLMSQLLGMS